MHFSDWHLLYKEQEMKTPLLSIIILHFLLPWAAGGKVQNVKYAEFIIATSGDNVDINCRMNFPLTPSSVIWTLDCADPMLLVDHPLYKGRVDFKFTNRQITILNVTENDSGMYCCHVETADGKRTPGNGTRLEVTRRVKECICERDPLLRVMEIVRIILLIVLIILLSIVIKKS